MMSVSKYNPPANGEAQPVPVLGVRVTPIQVGNEWGVSLTLQFGSLGTSVAWPTDAARAIGRELLKQADEADKALILPAGVRPGIPEA